MIVLTIYGLDQFVVGKLSHDMTAALAELYECDREEILFIAPEAMVFHNGVEQTSWNAIVKIDAPEKVAVLQSEAANLIIRMMQGPTINVQILFSYHSQDDFYESINNDYPRFIEEENLVHIEEERYSDHLEEGDGDDEIFTGDIFQDFRK